MYDCGNSQCLCGIIACLFLTVFSLGSDTFAEGASCVCVGGGSVEGSIYLGTHISRVGLSFQDNLVCKYSFEILRYFDNTKPNLYFCSFYHYLHNESVFHKAQGRIPEHFPMDLASRKKQY